MELLEYKGEVKDSEAVGSSGVIKPCTSTGTKSGKKSLLKTIRESLKKCFRKNIFRIKLGDNRVAVLSQEAIDRLLTTTNKKHKSRYRRYDMLSQEEIDRLLTEINDSDKDVINAEYQTVLKNVYDRRTDVFSGMVGLFWFSDDYSKIVEVSGVKVFGVSALDSKEYLPPDGYHDDTVFGSEILPRGRVTVDNGSIIVGVGTKCPQPAVDMVVKEFKLTELEKYKGVERVKVRREKHWDSK